MASIFSKIAKGEIPSYKIAETENCFAFLDISPIAKGHTLVIPKQEIDYIFDVEDDLLSELNIFAKKVAKAIQKAYPCPKVGIAVVGLEVPHAHIHLVPLNSVGDLDFKREKLEFSKEEFEEIANNIKSYLD
ncbi:MAG: HIT family protein [Bacteroidales bacterium]|jgi:histidine triad (HIT) family protein|nr:HIT family protein [Bacteroidales bacterium]MDD3725024.1 HIT family protein [Bacteroidales bacterium]MDY0054610.1 HIT family protein [Bacteroidales bacterium]